MLQKFSLLFLSFIFLASNVWACDEATASLTSSTNNGNGTFTYTFNVCREYLGLEGAPRDLVFTFNCGVTVSAGFSPASYVTSTNDIYTGTRSANVLTYHTNSVFIAHGSATLCGNFTITVSGHPTSVSINTNPNSTPAVCIKTIAISLLVPPTSTGTSICQNENTTLSALGCSGGNLNWYLASSGGSSLQTGSSYTTPTLVSNTTYHVDCSVTTGGCPSSRTPVTVTVNAAPAAPSVSASPTSVCMGGASTLTASAPSGTFNWYSLSSGGSALQSGSSFSTPTLAATTDYYVDCTVNGCPSARTGISISVDPCTLALELAAFRSNCKDNQVQLYWETLSEKGNDYFVIEKSENGVEFFPNGTVKSVGNSNAATQYFYTDESQSGGGSYYRIVQIDINGAREESSPIRAMLNCGKKGVSI
ncbi:MAG: hypothetical protein ACKVTZ_02525, partial [Bacteroidia bacterium]